MYLLLQWRKAQRPEEVSSWLKRLELLLWKCYLLTNRCSRILLPRPLSNDPRFNQCIHRYSHASKRFVEVYRIYHHIDGPVRLNSCVPPWKMHSLALQEQQLPRNESASNSQSVELLKWNQPDDPMDLPAKLFPFPYAIYKIIFINNKNRLYSLDVPRPLINDLWVYLFKTNDAECVKWASRVGTSLYVKAIIVNVNKWLKPFFLWQHINIVNTVTLQSFWFIFRISIFRKVGYLINQIMVIRYLN